MENEVLGNVDLCVVGGNRFPICIVGKAEISDNEFVKSVEGLTDVCKIFTVVFVLGDILLVIVGNLGFGIFGNYGSFKQMIPDRVKKLVLAYGGNDLFFDIFFKACLKF